MEKKSGIMFKDMEEIIKRNRTFVDSGEVLSSANFTEEQLLGNGSFARVYRAKSNSTGRSYALKKLSMLKIKSLGMLPQLRKEISVMSMCSHENIIYLYCAFEENNFTYLIQELADGSLFDQMASVRRFSEKQVANYVADIVRAVDYLHGMNPPIIHRDIKPENVLLRAGKCKIADFGWSSTHDDYRNTYCGTFDYLAPEMIRRAGHTEKLDVWTIGVLMFELLEGRSPFAVKANLGDRRLASAMVERNILSGKIHFEKTASKEAQYAVSQMLNVDSSKRPSAKEILQMKFFEDNLDKVADLPFKPPAFTPPQAFPQNLPQKDPLIICDKFIPSSGVLRPRSFESPSPYTSNSNIKQDFQNYGFAGRAESEKDEEIRRLSRILEAQQQKIDQLIGFNHKLEAVLAKRDISDAQAKSLELGEALRKIDNLEVENKAAKMTLDALSKQQLELNRLVQEKESSIMFFKRELQEKAKEVIELKTTFKEVSDMVSGQSSQRGINMPKRDNEGSIDFEALKFQLRLLLSGTLNNSPSQTSTATPTPLSISIPQTSQNRTIYDSKVTPPSTIDRVFNPPSRIYRASDSEPIIKTQPSPPAQTVPVMYRLPNNEWTKTEAQMFTTSTT